MIPPYDGQPRHRSILALDIESSTNRTNPMKSRLRLAMYDLLEGALRAADLDDRDRDPFVDRGDGVLALLHPVDRAPKTLLLNAVIPTLRAGLEAHNSRRPAERFRMRVAIHAGEVHYDRHGCYGEALDLTCRLLDAPEVKQALRDSTAPLVLVASEEIYRNVIRHGYPGIRGQDFHPNVRLRIADVTCQGWIHEPGLPPVSEKVTRLESYRGTA